MGLSFSRSVKFGALRFNFSNGGIGVSAGIPGFRIGTGPRGAYISGSVAGFRYRQSLGASRRNTGDAKRLPIDSSPLELPNEPVHNISHTVEHVSADVMTLRDASGDDLLQSMNEQAKKKRLWPAVAVALLICLVFLSSTLKEIHESANAFVLIFFIGVTLWVRHLDKIKKLTVLFYDVDAGTSSIFETLTKATASAQRVQKVRSVLATSTYINKKYVAGASQGLKLAKASVSLGQPPGVVANIDVPLVKAGSLCLAFMPDRILAFESGKVGAINYARLEAEVSPLIFIEKEGAPSDAIVVEHTWQYVNKNGGRDKRFKNNRQYPVCRYQELSLSSSSGLNVKIMGSKADSFDLLAGALRGIRKAIR